MKAVWSNPVIWGYKHGYSVAEIAAGLEIPEARVRGEIIAYERKITDGEITLRRNFDVLTKSKHIQRLGYWQRQRDGAREALAAIADARHAPRKAVRHAR